MLIRILTYLFILIFLGCHPLPIIEEKVIEDNTPKPVDIPIIEKVKKVEGEEYTDTFQQAHQLLAIKAFLKEKRLYEAMAELQNLNISQTYGLEIPLELLLIDLDLEKQQLEYAFQRLKSINADVLPISLRIEYQRLHAKALTVKQQPLAAVRLRIALNHLLSTEATDIDTLFWETLGIDLTLLFPPLTVKKNNQLLWHSLKTVELQALREIKQQPNDIFSGWVALALLEKTALSQGIPNWRFRFAQHPGEQVLSPVTAPVLKKIALLLPSLDTAFGTAGTVIKAGFYAAYKTDSTFERKKRPSITTYFVNETNVALVYQQAVDDGADMVVGPLKKETIQALQHFSQLPVPTVALNMLNTPIFVGNLYQFGLSPEDEIRAITKRAWSDGHRTACLLIPDGLWGADILKTFQSEWAALGGTLTFEHVYGKDFSLSIPLAFKKVKKRKAVFMVAISRQASIIRSFLPSHLPVYSISRIYSGTPSPTRDAGLTGIKFVDMPWILKPNKKMRRLRRFLPRDKKALYSRLYAFGIDAYNMLPTLQNLSVLQWQAYTGYLSINQNGEIHRSQLPVARFVNGKPKVLRDK